MHFSAFTSTLFITLAALNVTAVPTPAPIPPELQPIVAAKNNLGGVAVDNDDPRFLALNYSNGGAMPSIPMAYIAAASITTGTLLAAFV